MSVQYFIGVDGGGTKTDFVCIDASGQVCARSRVGPTYHLQVQVDGVERALSQGFGAIVSELRIALTDIAFAFIGLPAFGEDSVIDPQLDAACARILGHRRYECANDMVCGWAGSLGGEDGINLVAGTGSIGYGRREGREARVGGWGEVFSDEGSAYWIAARGLNAFTRMSDGRLARGALHALVVEELALTSDLDLCARTLGNRGLGRDGIAALAPLVMRAASAGDTVALTIVGRAADELGYMATALRNRLRYAPDERARISWSGGVLSKTSLVRDHLRTLLGHAGGFDVIEPRWDPAEGGAQYARRLSHRRSGPPADDRPRSASSSSQSGWTSRP